MQAEDYAGDDRVYSKTVSIDDVAWINTDEGQFVKNSKDKAEKAPLRFQLIGEQGAETLDKAEEASVRLDNLQVAKDMEAEKKDAKTVKLATELGAWC